MSLFAPSCNKEQDLSLQGEVKDEVVNPVDFKAAETSALSILNVIKNSKLVESSEEGRV